MPRTYGELRTLIADEGLSWQARTGKADHEPLPEPALGADPAELVRAGSSPRVDFSALGLSGSLTGVMAPAGTRDGSWARREVTSRPSGDGT